MGWLWTSLALSVLLTVVANVALRVFPGAGERFTRWLTGLASPDPRDVDPGDPDRRDARDTERVPPPDPDGPRLRVWVPWRAMIVASIGLTVLANLLLWLR